MVRVWYLILYSTLRQILDFRGRRRRSPVEILDSPSSEIQMALREPRLDSATCYDRTHRPICEMTSIKKVRFDLSCRCC